MNLVDATSVKLFLQTVFRHADSSALISPRSFLNKAGEPAFGVSFVAPGDAALAQCQHGAQIAADHPAGAVFAPPICTFKSPDNATEANIAQGLVLCVDCDERPQHALKRLTEIIGPPTMVVRSGGCWVDPETGEVEDKLHLYWVLRIPTEDAAGHGTLKHARQVAASLVKSDKSGVPIVHPMRCPGSWNTKAEPRMCEISALNADIELDLDDALAKLEAAATRAGIEVRPAGSGSARAKATEVKGQAALIATGCAFVRGLRDDAESQSEPMWFATLGILATCDDGSGEQAAHAWGSAYDAYTEGETAAKFDRAKREDKPARCSTIEGMGFEGCARCSGLRSSAAMREIKALSCSE